MVRTFSQMVANVRAAEVRLENVELGADAVVGDADGALPLMNDTVRRAIAALSAEAIGVMDTMQDLTNEYLKTREQFGRPIGKFQALQHRMVDILIACEESRSSMLVATLRLDDADDTVREKAISAAHRNLPFSSIRPSRSGRVHTTARRESPACEVRRNLVQTFGGLVSSTYVEIDI